MKTKFLGMLLVLLGLSSKAQTNAVYWVPSSTPVQGNSLFGVNAGISISGATGQHNTAVGYNALNANVSGEGNTAVGQDALKLTTGVMNTGIGYGALANNIDSYNSALGNRALGTHTTGGYNAVFGNRCMEYHVNGEGNVAMGWRVMGDLSVTSGSFNTGMGTTALFYNIGSHNTAFGYNAGFSNTTGGVNTFVGFYSGLNLTTGNFNTFIGRVKVPNTAATATTAGYNTSSTIILADGTDLPGHQKLYIHSNGNTGIGTGDNVIPNNRLEVKSSFATGAGASGLRLTNLTTADTPVTNPGNGVLTVNANGDVILVTDKTGTGVSGITNSCTTAGYIPKVIDSSGNLGCSSIFDDGNGHVGFGYGTTPPTTHNVSVNGTFATGAGPYNTSDRKFKKDIKPIEDALQTLMALEGKTYFWRTEEFRERNFRNDLQYGLIAQEVEKVLPSLIIKDTNGDYSLNYIELIPVLIEAIKEQQTQINDLKAQLSDSFKANNAELINLSNTKIISVSPNPSKDVITVSFNVEKSVMSAKLLVHDLNGNVVSSLNVNDRDNNITRTLQKDNFGAGVYIISLVVNGKSIDTKKIVFN